MTGKFFCRAPGGWLLLCSMAKELLPLPAEEFDPLPELALALLKESSIYNASPGRAYYSVT
jgi:hypothetical protein